MVTDGLLLKVSLQFFQKVFSIFFNISSKSLEDIPENLTKNTSNFFPRPSIFQNNFQNCRSRAHRFCSRDLIMLWGTGLVHVMKGNIQFCGLTSYCRLLARKSFYSLINTPTKHCQNKHTFTDITL